MADEIGPESEKQVAYSATGGVRCPDRGWVPRIGVAVRRLTRMGADNLVAGDGAGGVVGK
jgi:hypothetical protein